MAIKKSQLYSSIWKSCDELRGGMDASQYKDYVLALLFIKYISDKYAGMPYAKITVPEGASFKDMVALKGTKNIGDDINKKILEPIKSANNLSEMADFNNEDKLGSGDEMVKRVSNLIAIFENPALDFSKNRAEGDDILGDAYEYLMKKFATESGKSKGQFYTPSEVSRIIAKVIGIANTSNNTPTVYDPTCGSGSLLLKVADETSKKVTLFGQEKDNATAALAHMNMVLHDNANARILRENTLSTPLFLDGEQLKTFDFVVANPPFSYKSWSAGLENPDKYDRFKDFGTPPDKNGDYAFLLHIIRSMKTTGKGACILPHGVLFRGNAEEVIRTNIIRRGYIKGIIGLPANLFYGTGIPACIIVLDKENAENRKGIFMIDASKDFVKDGNKNRLRAQDLHKIVDAFNKQTEIPKYSRMVSLTEIEKKEFNLNLPRYIDNQKPEDLQDIEAHLKGGIPLGDIEALQNYWDVYPTLKTSLFGKNERKGFANLKIASEEIKNTIFSHPEFTAYAKTMDITFSSWKKRNVALLKGLGAGLKPRQVIEEMSEDILKDFSKTDLIYKYDIYEQLMEYWEETMQDDMYLIAVDGWKAELVPVEGKKRETECDLVPKHIVANHYFSEEKREIEKLQTESANNGQESDEFIEENNSEDGYFAGFEKINLKNVSARIKEIEKTVEDAEELKVLQKYLEYDRKDLKIWLRFRKAEEELVEKVTEKYKTLAEEEIKTLVVDDKWMATLEQSMKGEMDRISQRLTGRIKELAERYATPLPILVDETENLKKKVDEHLKKMGFEL